MTEPITTTPEAAPAVSVLSPFDGLECLHCGEKGIVVNVDDMLIRCTECNDEFDERDLKKQFSLWEKLFRWITLAKDA